MMKTTRRKSFKLVALLVLPALCQAQKFAVTMPAVSHLPASARNSAQDSDPVTGFSAPVLGYVIDADGAVRKMPGLAGASWLTPPMHFAIRFRAVAVSPRQDYVLGLAGQDDAPIIQALAGGQGTARFLDGVVAGADRIVLSPSGAAAAFYFSASASLQIVTGLPDAPQAAASVDLSSLPGPAASLAITDDGSLVLASAPTADGAAVFALSSKSPPRLLLNGGDWTLAFLRNSTDAVLADRLRNTLYRIREAAGPGEIVLLATASDGISAPVAVGASADRSRFFVANSGAATIGYVSAAGGPLTLLSCNCSPTTLASLSGNAVFRLTEVSGEPIWLLDADAPDPRLLLVPQDTQRRILQ